MHSWKDTLDYSNQAMDGALSFEKSLKEFYFRFKDFSRDVVKFDVSEAFVKFTPVEKSLLKSFQEKKASIHKFLCDSINTPSVMKEISSLITLTNIYMTGNYNLPSYNHVLVKDVAIYITNLMKIFGVVDFGEQVGYGSAAAAGSSGESVNLEETLMPYLQVLSKFRDDVRVEARAKKEFDILKICDNLRDNVLPDLGVLIEDLSDRTVVKLCDKETLIKEREQKQLAVQRKAAEELKRQEELNAAKREKEAKKSIPPNELFAKEIDKYTKFDEKGIPTHDLEEKELSKSSRKKLEKLYEAQVKSYEEFLKKQSEQPVTPKEN
jgi:cysteinyl-tRNA synthetase